MVGGVFGIVVAIFLGALIGLQREYTQQHLNYKSFAGFRTFILVAFLGSILGYLTKSFDSTWVILGFVATVLFAVSAYFVLYKNSKNVSGTTEIAFILTYILGVMATTGNSELAVVFGIIIATFLTFKERLHGIAKRLESKELVGMIEFALIAFVVLPFLPNKNYSPLDIPGLGNVLTGLGASSKFLSQLDIFNLHTIWLMVIFIAGINLVGYFAVKLIGSKRGYGIIGFVGGLVSSTAVTLSMAEESKENKKVFHPFLLATIIASSVMFIRVIFEVAVVNSLLLPSLVLPMGVMAILGFGIAFMFYKRKNKKKKEVEEVELKQPFALGPALKFGGFFVLILFLSKLTQILFGKIGIYFTSLFSGLADFDAITLTMSNLSKTGEIGSTVATIAIILAVASNTLVKAGIAYFMGNKKFGRIVFGIFSLILLVGLAVLFFI